MSADSVYNSIKLETPPTVCSTQAASASEEEASRFMFLVFDCIAKGDKKGIPLLCLTGVEQRGGHRPGQARLFTFIHKPYLTAPQGLYDNSTFVWLGVREGIEDAPHKCRSQVSSTDAPLPPTLDASRTLRTEAPPIASTGNKTKT
ncbi:hypothetical protein ARMGADRAFT_1038393 [Armillaria gallica]|uniref:Uncharacterized protein n=1 Tax=Armillaria gallica TaxID=47427 RepID=A0A2H3CMW7_ARMGA|nr:hypothetical protein ARMGADRAFT_1038393 [Armillaria gallica]